GGVDLRLAWHRQLHGAGDPDRRPPGDARGHAAGRRDLCRGEHPDRHRARPGRSATAGQGVNPILRKLSRDVPAMIGLAIVVIVLLLAIFGPLLAPYPEDAAASHLARRLKPPTEAYLFGTDNLGRDIFSRVILGARGTLQVAVTVVFV